MFSEAEALMADERDQEIASLRARVAALEADRAHGHLDSALAREEVWRRTIDAMPGGIVHVRADGAILEANAEALRILGLSFDALTERYTSDFDAATLSENGEPCRMEDYPVTRALVTGEPQAPVTIGIRRKNGSIAWAIFTAVPVKDPRTGSTAGAIVTFLDITARREVEAALREREALLHSVLTSAPNPIAYTDRRGNIRYVNRTPAGDTSGLSEIVGKPVWDHFSGPDEGLVKGVFDEVMATREIRHYESEARGRRFVVTVGPVIEGNEAVGAAFVALDVTEQRALETKMLIADRMAAIGTLTAGIAHEINNPLTYVLANVEWLARGLEKRDDGTHARIAAIREGIGRIRSIVADVSTLSHAGEARRTLVDVHEMLESALRFADGTIRQRAHVVRLFSRVPAVEASDSRLAQVFLNLILNAAQAIGDGDPVRDAITITTKREGNSVTVTVEDSGPGIPESLLPRIFDPFVTTKPVGSGTGLGLYICRNVVSAHGGEITAENRPEGGARFRVVLPAASTTHADDEHDALPPPSAHRRLRILVVDDERPIVEILTALLDEHDVVPAYDGAEAIVILEDGAFDLVLCDLVMPRKTGMDVYDFLRKRRPGEEQRIVFITGGASNDRMQSFLRATPNHRCSTSRSGRTSSRPSSRGRRCSGSSRQFMRTAHVWRAKDRQEPGAYRADHEPWLTTRGPCGTDPHRDPHRDLAGRIGRGARLTAT